MLDWVEAEFLQTRGYDPATGRRPRVKADGLVAATFRHVASRNNDPRLHTHAVIANMTRNMRASALSRHDLVTLTRLVTAYAMRRAVCGYKPAAPPPVFAKASERHRSGPLCRERPGPLPVPARRARLPLRRRLPRRVDAPQHVPLQASRCRARAVRKSWPQGNRATRLLYHQCMSTLSSTTKIGGRQVEPALPAPSPAVRWCTSSTKTRTRREGS